MLGQRSRQYFSMWRWLSEGCFKYIRGLCAIVNLTNMFIYWLTGFLCVEKMTNLLLDPVNVYSAGGLILYWSNESNPTCIRPINKHTFTGSGHRLDVNKNIHLLALSTGGISGMLMSSWSVLGFQSHHISSIQFF